MTDSNSTQQSRTGSVGCAFFVAPFAVALLGAAVALALVIRQSLMGIYGSGEAAPMVMAVGFLAAVLTAFAASLIFLPFYFLLRAKKIYRAWPYMAASALIAPVVIIVMQTIDWLLFPEDYQARPLETQLLNGAVLEWFAVTALAGALYAYTFWRIAKPWSR
jgi:hypothetical protein